MDVFRQLLDNPDALRTYIDAYVAERQRLAGDLAKKRLRAENELAKAKAAHDRALKNLIYGHISTESWLAIRPELERNIALTEAAVARTEAAPKIDLHPAAISNYKAALDNLHDTMVQEAEAMDDSFARSLRDIVNAVIVHPVETGRPLKLEIHGKLAALTGDGGAILLVAGACNKQFSPPALIRLTA